MRGIRAVATAYGSRQRPARKWHARTAGKESGNTKPNRLLVNWDRGPGLPGGDGRNADPQAVGGQSAPAVLSWSMYRRRVASWTVMPTASHPRDRKSIIPIEKLAIFAQAAPKASAAATAHHAGTLARSRSAEAPSKAPRHTLRSVRYRRQGSRSCGSKGRCGPQRASCRRVRRGSQAVKSHRMGTAATA